MADNVGELVVAVRTLRDKRDYLKGSQGDAVLKTSQNGISVSCSDVI